MEIRLFSGLGVTETLLASRSNSSLTSKAIEVFDVSISRMFKSAPAVVSVERKYSDRNYDDRSKYQVLRNALQTPQIFPVAQDMVQQDDLISPEEDIYKGRS